MSSAVDMPAIHDSIAIVSQSNLAKIESFFKDSSYRETIEFSANFNTRLCDERRLRLPFLDPQTGVAQNHSHLFMDRRERMPGFRAGQIYTYPAARWRKSRRQYLSKMYRFPDRPFQALRKEHEAMVANSSFSMSAHSATGTASPSLGNAHNDSDLLNGTFLEESSSLGGAGGDTSDSKDSQQQQLTHTQQHMKEDLSKEWFYDDMDMNDVDSLEDPKSPADDEYDYDPRYGSKKRRKRRPGKRATIIPGEGSTRRRSGAGRGRVNVVSSADTSFGGMDGMDGVIAEGSLTPTTSSGRRSRGTRGRRRTKASNTGVCNQPLSPGLTSEPPSFESAAAAVGVATDSGAAEEHADLRNYRKYL